MPRIYELWYGGPRMASSDIWSSTGNGYWENRTAVADNGMPGIAAQFTKGRAFLATRRFMPKYNEDTALYAFLTEQVPKPVIGDVFNLFVIPKHHRIESILVHNDAMPAGVEGEVELYNLGADTVVAGSNIPINSISARKKFLKNIGASFNTDTVVRFRVTVRDPDMVGAFDWEDVEFSVDISGMALVDNDDVIHTEIAPNV